MPIGIQSGTDATVITYTYDSLYRLTGAVYSTPSGGSGQVVASFAYTYDPVGNRKAFTQTVGLSQTVHSYAYDNADRLTTVDGQTYTWDDNPSAALRGLRGNLTNDGVRSYDYDAADRLTGVSGGVSASYTYNGESEASLWDGLLVSQNIGGTPTTFTWDVAAGLPQVLATSGGATYFYGLGLLAQKQSDVWRYPLADGLGSIRYMTDPRGQSLSHYSFDPFGVPLSPSGGQPFGYAGEQPGCWSGRIL